jgi:DNA-binding CsgD family transcriptional regulator
MTGGVEALVGAGFEALGAGSWAAAREAFEAVLSQADAAEAYFGLASALFWLGDMPGTITNYERAYAAFVKRPDHLYAAISALALVVHNKQHLGNHVAAAGWLARAGTLIDENGIEALRVGRLVIKAYETADPAQREAWGREAIELGRASGDVEWELPAMSVLGKALCEQGRVAEGMALLDEAMAGALGGQAGFDNVVFTSCQTMLACTMCAEFERAAQWVRAADRFTEQYGCPFLFAECRTIYGRVLFQTGEWERSERELAAAVEMSRGVADAFTVQATGTLAELRLAQGRIEEADRLLDAWQGHPEIVGAAARIHLARGEPEATIAVVVRRLDVIGHDQIESAALLDVLGEAEIVTGDTGAARGRSDALSALGASLDCRIITAHAERLRGRAIGASEPDAARRHLDVAVAEFLRMGMPYETARTRMVLVDVLPDGAAASGEARAALAAFEALGARRDADAAAALLREHGIAGGRARPRSEGTLTMREQEVLELLGQGLPNAEIAARLFLSRRTVEHHVASILSKLGLRTRAEAAAFVARK